MKKIVWLSFAIALICTACNKNVYYSEIQTIPDEKWDIKSPLTFTVDITDSMQYFDMYMHVRNTTDFQTQNFYVFMNTKYPDGHSEIRRYKMTFTKNTFKFTPHPSTQMLILNI